MHCAFSVRISNEARLRYLPLQTTGIRPKQLGRGLVTTVRATAEASGEAAAPAWKLPVYIFLWRVLSFVSSLHTENLAATLEG